MLSDPWAQDQVTKRHMHQMLERVGSWTYPPSTELTFGNPSTGPPMWLSPLIDLVLLERGCMLFTKRPAAVEVGTSSPSTILKVAELQRKSWKVNNCWSMMESQQSITWHILFTTTKGEITSKWDFQCRTQSPVPTSLYLSKYVICRRKHVI